VHILIIDDHPLYREVLSDHLKKFFSAAIVYESASIEEALVLTQYKQFDMICLDLSLPGQSGLQGFLALREVMPVAFIVIISGVNDSVLVKRTIDHGANGYISKSVSGQEMNNALALIVTGEVYISPCILLAAAASEKNSVHQLTKKLTPRQQDVFRLMSKGLSNKLIASQLACAEGTIKLHVSAILRTMKVSNRTEAVQAMARCVAES
jgi:DNA-binding NarL/FixJ family response regulator